MEKFVQRIYHDLKYYNQAISKIPAEDVKQEIRFAILTARKEQIYRVAHRLVDALCRDFGYSRKKGKDQFQPFYSRSTFSPEENTLLDAIDEMYRTANMTAREVATALGCEYNKTFQKTMHQCFPKGMGLGGARKGAGQKNQSPVSISAQ